MDKIILLILAGFIITFLFEFGCEIFIRALLFTTGSKNQIPIMIKLCLLVIGGFVAFLLCAMLYDNIFPPIIRK